MEQNNIYTYNKNNENHEYDFINECDKNLDIINIVDVINNNIIKFSQSKKRLKIKSKSIKKIFSLIELKDDLSDIFTDYIILNIITYIRHPKEINNEKNNELDIKYEIILEKTNLFYINIEKTKNENIEDINDRIKIHRKSLLKIFSFLNETIITKSDFILIVIVLIKEEIENNISNYKINNYFMIDLKIPIKNKEQNIYKFDILFNNVLNSIDDYEKESSFSDDIIKMTIPKKKIDEELIKNNLNLYEKEEGILTDRDLKTEKNNIIYNDENRNICNKICILF